MQESHTILLVEDCPDDVLLTRLAFEQAEITYRLVVVSNGEQAVEYLKGEGRYVDRQQFPIPGPILLDLNMPRMTGFEFLAWLRQEPELKHLPVIVLTGSLNPADAEHAYQAGANCFLPKPTRLTEWAAALTKICAFCLELSEPPETSVHTDLALKETKPNPFEPPDERKMAA